MKRLIVTTIVLLGFISFAVMTTGPVSALVAVDENGKPLPYTPPEPDVKPGKDGGPVTLQPDKADSDKGNKGKPGPKKKIIIELTEPGKNN